MQKAPATEPQKLPKPLNLDYRYEFSIDEVDQIVACNNDHGFAIVKDAIDQETVEKLRAEVREACDVASLEPGKSRNHMAFIEVSPTLMALHDDPKIMKLAHALISEGGLTVHRSAAIARRTGSNFVGWHSDFQFSKEPPKFANDLLNRGEWPNGMWFYLNGSHADRGGLLIIPESHAIDWEGPEGIELQGPRRQFAVGEDGINWNVRADVPGAMLVETNPQDLIIFAARTYHAALPNKSEDTRLSAAIVWRPKDHPLTPETCPWGRTESAEQFVPTVPDRHKPLFEDYVGIDLEWRDER